ncbi:hypothetical protein [Nonomuraea sp. NPDC049129]|uniref:hypothetical protein n=1 Tax=Nonomuraea sp. NPDC049129 TaxID=3155272 RepID=UPI00340E2010
MPTHMPQCGLALAVLAGRRNRPDAHVRAQGEEGQQQAALEDVTLDGDPRSPLRLVTFTPPAEPSASAPDSWSRPAVMRFFRSAINAFGFSGYRIAA